VGLNKEPAACRSLKDSIIKNDNPYGLPETDSFKYNTKQKAGVLYYMGPEVNYKNNEIADAVIKVLNSAKIEFTMLEREPDCGKILSLLGYESDAKVKAKKLYEMIKKSGCKALIISCPLCYDAFKNDYPEWGLALEPEVKVYHISEYIHELANTGKLKIKKTDKKVSLADSEYLAIFNDLMKEPRELLKLSADGNLIDLAKSKESVLATGEAAFLINGEKFDMGEEINKSNCERAKESGADIIVTLSAVAKNNIAKCSDLEVMDIAEFVGGLI
jgi:Fe-S oxidoreductase